MFPVTPITPAHLSTVDTFGQFGALGNIATAVASTAFPTANKIFYIPFRVPYPLVITTLQCFNGAAVAGNVDIGIYSVDGRLIVNSGSTAQAGTTTLQTFNITDTLLGGGVYYFAITLSDAGGTLHVASPAVGILEGLGILSETTGGFGLPALATFAPIADAFLPLLSLSTGVAN